MSKEPTAVEAVTMADGRIVEFAGKRKMLKESIIDEAAGTVAVRLDFRNGETRLYTNPQNMRLRMEAHGVEQKLGDEIAGLAEVDDCVLAVDELIDRLYNGDFNQRREGNSMAGTSVLARALVEHTGKTIEQIKAFLSGKSQAEKTALRNNPRLKPIVDRIEAEKVSKGTKVDTEALLSELS